MTDVTLQILVNSGGVVAATERLADLATQAGGTKAALDSLAGATQTKVAAEAKLASEAKRVQMILIQQTQVVVQLNTAINQSIAPATQLQNRLSQVGHTAKDASDDLIGLGKQLFNIGVGAAKGVDPIEALIRQGPQLARSFVSVAQAGVNVGSILKSLTGMVSAAGGPLGIFAKIVLGGLTFAFEENKKGVQESAEADALVAKRMEELRGELYQAHQRLMDLTGSTKDSTAASWDAAEAYDAQALAAGRAAKNIREMSMSELKISLGDWQKERDQIWKELYGSNLFRTNQQEKVGTAGQRVMWEVYGEKASGGMGFGDKYGPRVRWAQDNIHSLPESAQKAVEAFNLEAGTRDDKLTRVGQLDQNIKTARQEVRNWGQPVTTVGEVVVTGTPPAKGSGSGSGGGGFGGGAQQQRETLEHQIYESTKSVSEALQAELQAQIAISDDIDKIAQLKAAQIKSELAEQAERIKEQVASKQITQEAGEKALAIRASAANEQLLNVAIEREVTLRNQAVEHADAMGGFQQRVFAAQSELATSIEDRHSIELEALDARQQQERQELINRKLGNKWYLDQKELEELAAQENAQEEERTVVVKRQIREAAELQLQHAETIANLEIGLLKEQQSGARGVLKKQKLEAQVLEKQAGIQRARLAAATETNGVGKEQIEQTKKEVAIELQIIDEQKKRLNGIDAVAQVFHEMADVVGNVRDAWKRHDFVSLLQHLSTAIETIRTAFAQGGTLADKIAVIGGLLDGLGRAIGGKAGGVVSGIGSGASAGATLGSIIPGIGNVVGAAIGGVLGGIAGLFGGKDSQRKQEAAEQARLELEARQAAAQDNIKNAMDYLNRQTVKDLEYSNKMLQHLRSIDDKIGQVTGYLARQLSLPNGAFSTEGLGLGTTSKNAGLVGSGVGAAAGAGLGLAASSALGLGVGTQAIVFAGHTLLAAAAPTLLSTALGVAVPIVGALIGAVLGPLLFTAKRTVSVADQGVNFQGGSLGDILAGGIDGESYQDLLIKTKKKFLGITYSNKSQTQTVSGELDENFSNQVTLILGLLKDSVVEAADILGVKSADELLNALQINLGRISLEGLDSNQIQERLSAVFGEAADAMANAAIPGLTAFQEAGESAFETLARVVSEYSAVEAGLESIGMVFGKGAEAFGLASVAARHDLIELAGGVDAFLSQTDFFRENFLKEDERMAPIIASVHAEMARLGKSSTTTIEGFKDLVLGLDLTDAGNRQLYTDLMAVAPAFFTMTTYLNGLNDVVEEVSVNVPSLTDAWETFKERFLSVAVQLEPAHQRLIKGLADLGLAYVDTADEFRDAVLNAPAGSAARNALLLLVQDASDWFDYIEDLATDASAGLSESAARIQAMWEDFAGRFVSDTEQLRPAWDKARGDFFSLTGVVLSSSAQFASFVQVLRASDTATSDLYERVLALTPAIDDWFTHIANQWSFFADNFLSEAARLAPAQSELTNRLNALAVQFPGLGIGAGMTRDAFARLLVQVGPNSALGQALLDLAPLFDVVADAADQAAERIRGQWNSFSQAFLGAAAQVEPAQQRLIAGLGALGLAYVDTREEFRDAVLAAPDGSERRNALLALVDDATTYFAYLDQVATDQAAEWRQRQEDEQRAQEELTQRIKEQLQARVEAAQAAYEQATSVVDSLRQSLSDAIARELDRLEQKLQAATDATAEATERLSRAYDRERAALEATVQEVDRLTESLTDFIGDLRDKAAEVFGPAGLYAGARAAFEANAGAALGGDVKAAGKVQDLGQAFAAASLASSRTALDYIRDVARIQAVAAGTITALNGAKTVAEQQLDTLKQQVQGLLKIDDDVISVSQAVGELTAKMSDEARAKDERDRATRQLTALEEGFKENTVAVLSIAEAVSKLEDATAAQAARKIELDQAQAAVDAINNTTASVQSVALLVQDLAILTQQGAADIVAAIQTALGLPANDNPAPGVAAALPQTPYAMGGAFTGPVSDILNRPTQLAVGIGGEAGPEAIMPLRRGPGGALGVRALGGGSATAEEIRALREELAELRAALRAPLERIDRSNKKISDTLIRVTRDGDAMLTEAA